MFQRNIKKINGPIRPYGQYTIEYDRNERPNLHFILILKNSYNFVTDSFSKLRVEMLRMIILIFHVYFQ